MATWGSYFSSYVKKISDQKQVELEEISEKEILSKTSGAPRRSESISSQESSSSAKKLYEIETEQINQPFQRSNSNAARVARMFGYGNSAPTTEMKVEEFLVQPVAPLATWTKIESKIVQPVVPLAVQSKAETTEMPVVVVPPTTQKVERKMQPANPIKPISKQDVFAMLEDFAKMANNSDITQILPDLSEKNPVVAEIKVQKVFTPEETKENPASSRKDLFRGQVSRQLSRQKLLVSNNPQAQPSDDFQARMLEFERQSEEMRLEKQRRDEEHEQILRYERMSEQFRLERESMEIERARMLEEQVMFQAEADRITEEESQMAQFMKDFQMEMDRDRENEARKLRAAQEAELQRKKAIEAAEQAAQEDEFQRQRVFEAAEQAEKAAKRQRQIAIEDEERRLKEETNAERELELYEQRRAQRQRDAEDKKLRAQLKAERLAQEDADRLAAKLREEQEAERLRNEYAAELEADRRKFLQEEAGLERQRVRDERIAAQRRVARERAERAQYEEEESRRRAREIADRQFSAERRFDLDQELDSDDDRPLTKEEEMKKAEEKIRQAFAGLAKERGQEVSAAMQRSNTVASQMPRSVKPVENYAKGLAPTGTESRVYEGGPDRQMPDRVVSRYNTVAGRPPLPEKPGVLRRPPRNQSGSVGSIGLPGGPKAGLPTRPRRSRTVQ